MMIVAWVLQYDSRWLSDPRQVTAAYLHLVDRAVRHPVWRWFLGAAVTGGLLWRLTRLVGWLTHRDPRTLERR